MHIKPSFSKQKDYQPNVVQEEGYKDLFYEEWNHFVENSVSDGFKKDFSLPIYDEYEEDYLDNVSKQPTNFFANSGRVSKEKYNQANVV